MAGDKSLTSEPACFGPFRLVGAERLLLKNDTPVSIGGRALDILIALIGRAGQVLSRRELIDFAWPDVVVEEANLRTHIAALRKALGDGEDGIRYIINVPGRGYSFVAPIQRAVIDVTHQPGAPSGFTPLQSLPAPPHFLVGRNESIETISLLLLSRRFVSVVGPGGIGKTTVAVAVAHSLHQEFGEGAVFFVDLSLLTDQADVPNAVASALGCVVQGPDPEPYMLAFLRDRRVLIVLDNCEHVIDAVARLGEDLYGKAPGLHLLTTSREALRAGGENVHFLMPLEGPPEDAPTALQALASPAVQLFMERAASSGHGTELSDSEAPIVASVCRRLDGIALAIELVASRVGAYGIEGTANLLDHGAELLLQGRRGTFPRHQTLHAMLDWSFNLLPAYEQAVLRTLSIFGGQFSLDAAISVARQSDRGTEALTNAIVSLIDKSLISVSVDGGSAYFRLLDTTRTYASAKLAESGETAVMAQRHAHYFAGILEAVDGEGSFFHRRDAAAYAPHMSNIRKALAWSFSNTGDRSVGVDLTIRAAPLLLGLSLFAECERWCQRAMEALRHTDHGIRKELALQMALAMSSMYTHGNRNEVKAAIERGLELNETLQDGRHQFDLLSGLHAFLTRAGDFDGALAIAERSSVVAKANGDTTEKAVSEWMLGTAKHCTGDQAAAIRHCRFGLQLVSGDGRREAGFFGSDQRLIGLVTLARALWMSGFPDEGCKTARQAIKEAEVCDHPVTYCIVVIYSIYVLLWSGDFKTASALTETIFERAERYSLGPYRAVSLALKGELKVIGGDALTGIEVLREALGAMLSEQHHIIRSPTICALAMGLRYSGRLNEARDVIDQGLGRAKDMNEILWLPDLLRTRGEILQDLSQLKLAEASLLRSVDHARKQSALSWQLKAAIPLARLLAKQGRNDDARSTLEDLYRRFKEGFGTRDLIAARQLLDELS